MLPKLFHPPVSLRSRKCHISPAKRAHSLCIMREQTLRPSSLLPSVSGKSLSHRRESRGSAGSSLNMQPPTSPDPRPNTPLGPFAVRGNVHVFAFSLQSPSRDPRGDVAAKTWKLGTSLPPQQNLGGGQGWARGSLGVTRPFAFTVGLAQG